MPPRRTPRGTVSRKDDAVNSGGKLQFFLESGRSYRPFKDPTRIRNIDAKKANLREHSRTLGVPDEFLGVLKPSIEASSTASPTENASSRDPPSSIRYQSNAFPSFGDHSSKSASPSPSPSPHTPSAGTPSVPHDLHSPEPSYPCTFNFDYASRQTYPTQVYSDCLAPARPDTIGLDLEDPAVVAKALEVARTMKLEDIDLDLLRMDPEDATLAPLQNTHPCQAPFSTST